MSRKAEDMLLLCLALEQLFSESWIIFNSPKLKIEFGKSEEIQKRVMRGSKYTERTQERFGLLKRKGRNYDLQASKKGQTSVNKYARSRY